MLDRYRGRSSFGGRIPMARPLNEDGCISFTVFAEGLVLVERRSDTISRFTTKLFVSQPSTSPDAEQPFLL